MKDDPAQPAGGRAEPTIERWARTLANGNIVLDVAAGNGRHARFFAARGDHVTAVDRDVTALRELADARIEVLEADLEAGPWPLGDRTFDVVVVVNYLWRPLLPRLLASVAPRGHLLYETFGVGNERFGRPRNPDFLLRAGELLDAVVDAFDVLDHDHGPVGSPPTAVRQRLFGRRR